MSLRKQCQKYGALAVVAASGLYVGAANATIDVSATTTAMSGDGVTTITSIGVGLLGMAVVAVIFKWAKGAIFG